MNGALWSSVLEFSLSRSLRRLRTREPVLDRKESSNWNSSYSTIWLLLENWHKFVWLKPPFSPSKASFDYQQFTAGYQSSRLAFLDGGTVLQTLFG